MGQAFTVVIVLIAFASATLKLIESLQKPEHKTTWVYRYAEAMWLFVAKRTLDTVIVSAVALVTKTLTKGPSNLVKRARRGYHNLMFGIYVGLARSNLSGRDPWRAAFFRDTVLPWLGTYLSITVLLRAYLGQSLVHSFVHGLIIALLTYRHRLWRDYLPADLGSGTYRG